VTLREESEPPEWREDHLLADAPRVIAYLWRTARTYGEVRGYGRGFFHGIDVALRFGRWRQAARVAAVGRTGRGRSFR
jgi:hypothetical protein